jgi:phosphate transport system substrate-binding protein
MLTTVRNFRRSMLTLVTGLSIALLATSHALAGETLKVAVANTVKASVLKKIEVPFKNATGISLEYPHEKGSLAGKEGFTRNTLYLKELLDGNVEGAIASVPADEWLEIAKKEHVEIPTSAGITQRVVGRILYRVHAHPEIGVKNLNSAQFTDLFTGKYKNWKELGGPDQKIIVIVCKEQPAINAAFERIVLHGTKISGDARVEKSNEDVYDAVKSTKGAVTFELVGSPTGVTDISVPAIGRPITLMTKGRPSANMEKLVEFIRNKSQELGLGL